MIAPEKDRREHEALSSIVRRLEETMPRDESVTVGRLLSLLGVHGFVFFLLTLALLNIVIFMLPGLSIVFGVPMVILAVQMLLGHQAPLFPAFVRQRAVRSDVVHRGLGLAAAALERMEVAIKPRLLFLTAPVLLRLHALAALCLAFMVAVPIPFVNLPPSVGMVLLTIGLLQRDGAFVLLAYGAVLWSIHIYESLGQIAQNIVGG